ncbi:DUF4013 domain-containing protein [Halococcus sp. AFM35]|uniref:DUF4013 domain-containing protein n=1 Tax=Halococcus sp. AFM35 TaxID=3421653 RepID=UPI003EB9A03D
MDTDIETLLRYPLQSETWLSTVLIGGIALLLSFLLIPLFVVAGYGMRAIRAGMDRAAEPPVFDDWGELLTEGFVASIIGFVYQLVPTVVFFTVVGGSLAALVTGSDLGAGIGVVGLFGGLFVWWLLAIAFGYVGVAGVANYAREGSFGAGFDLDTIASVVTSREYLLAWVYVVLLNIAVGIVGTALNVVPILGGIVGVFVGFYAFIIAAWLLGDGFAAATKRGPRTTSTGDSPIGVGRSKP